MKDENDVLKDQRKEKGKSSFGLFSLKGTQSKETSGALLTESKQTSRALLIESKETSRALLIESKEKHPEPY